MRRTSLLEKVTLSTRLASRLPARALALLDVLIGMAIFALIAVIAVIVVGNYRHRAFVTGAISDARSIGLAIESAAIKDGAYASAVAADGTGDRSIVARMASLNKKLGVITPGNRVGSYGYLSATAADGSGFRVCVEHVENGAVNDPDAAADAHAVYDSIKGGVIASGDGDCDNADVGTGADPDGGPGGDPTAGPEPTPTPPPVPAYVNDEYDVVSLDYKGDLLAYPNRGGQVSDDGEWVLWQQGGLQVHETVGQGTRSYLRNRVTGAITVFDRKTADGPVSGGIMYGAKMTPSASHIVFTLHGNNMWGEGGNGASGGYLFVWTRATQTIERIDPPGGTKTPGFGYIYGPLDISDDGRYLAFESNHPQMVGIPGYTGGYRIVRYDRQTDTTMLIDHAADGTPGNSTPYFGQGVSVDLSGDGQHVAFTSTSTNLVPAATSGRQQVYKWSAATDKVTLISRNTAGDEAANAQSGPAVISGDGRYVAWTGVGPDITGSPAYDSVAVVRDTNASGITIVSKNANGTNAANSNVLSMTNDGRILYRSASNAVPANRPGHGWGWQLFVWNPTDQTNRSVSKRDASNGGNYDGMISSNGAFVAFELGENAGYPTNAIGNGRSDIIVWSSAATPSP